MSSFDVAEFVDLDCGSFDIKIRQAAAHNERFRAAVAKRSLNAKKKSLVIQQGTQTGSYEEDIELYLDCVIEGWGERPMKDDSGDDIPFTRENMREIFNTKEGKVLFGKIQLAASDDSLFAIREEDEKN